MVMPKKILVSLDLTSESQQVIEKAVELARQSQASLVFLHVVEPVITDSNYVLPDTYMDLEEALIKRGEVFLHDAAAKITDINVSTQVSVGSVKAQVFQKVEEDNIDLIVMGTHGRHGLARLLGSTASAILHGVPCDVYMVRIKS